MPFTCPTHKILQKQFKLFIYETLMQYLTIYVVYYSWVISFLHVHCDPLPCHTVKSFAHPKNVPTFFTINTEFLEDCGELEINSLKQLAVRTEDAVFLFLAEAGTASAILFTM